MNAPVAQEALLKTLLVSELVDRARQVERLGDERASELFARHDRLARDLLPADEGEEIERRQGFVLLFERPISAVRYALAYHRGLTELARELDVELGARVGIHLGEVVLVENSPEDVERGASPMQIEGMAKLTAARVSALARGRQTLLTGSAFDLARRATVGTRSDDDAITWLAHGRYLFKGTPEPMEIFEAGAAGIAPLEAPTGSATAYHVSADETVLGWRPAVGLEVPQRPRWMLQNKLGEGGFGEVWLAAHEKTGDRRVFKFCFELERLRGLQREITLFRLLKETLGDRQDITRILDWNFEEAPYFIESEYTSGGDLGEWAEAQGGIAQVALETRLEIVAQAAEALAAAHSVGVLHKDVKPANILIYTDAQGNARTRLTDFGIGLLIEPDRLEQTGITMLGMTEIPGETELSPGTGTRLYMAPELLAGEAATVQADVYALGIILYQVVVGDFTRALAAGWERDVEDEVLRGDIAWAVDGSPQQRMGNAWRLAEWLRTLDERREKRAAERRAREEAERAKAALERAHQRRKLVVAAVTVLVLFAGGTALQERRARRAADRARQEAESARQVSQFLVDLFGEADPGKAQGRDITVREVLDQGVANIPRGLEGQPLVRARFLDVLGTIYMKTGSYESAEGFLKEALAIRRQYLDELDMDLISSLIHLAELYYQQEQIDTSQDLSRDALRRAESAPDPDLLLIAESLNGLAKCSLKLQRYDEAEAFLQRARKTAERALGPDDHRLGPFLSNLASVYWYRGELEKVLPLYQSVLAIEERKLGSNHPSVAIDLNNLGLYYETLGEYTAAEPLYRRALAIQEMTLGEDHPQVASTLTNLGIVYENQGRYTLAEQRYLRALEIDEQALGAEHSHVAIRHNELAILYLKRGDLDLAELEAENAKRTLEKALRPESEQVARSQCSLGEVRRQQKHIEEAERLLLDAQRIFGEFPETRCLTSLANLYRDQNRLDEAETLYQRALELEGYDSKHPDAAELMNQYAVLLRAQDRESEAVRMAARAQEILEQIGWVGEPQDPADQRGSP